MFVNNYLSCFCLKKQYNQPYMN